MSRVISRTGRCPFCKERWSVYDRTCGACRADLALLSELHLLPYAFFNEGLACLESGDPGGAVVKLGAALELDPGLEDARGLMVRVATRLGWSELAARFDAPATPAAGSRGAADLAGQQSVVDEPPGAPPSTRDDDPAARTVGDAGAAPVARAEDDGRQLISPEETVASTAAPEGQTATPPRDEEEPARRRPDDEPAPGGGGEVQAPATPSDTDGADSHEASSRGPDPEHSQAGDTAPEDEPRNGTVVSWLRYGGGVLLGRFDSERKRP